MPICLVLWMLLLAAPLVAGPAAAQDSRIQVREDHFVKLTEAPQTVTVGGELTAFAAIELYHSAGLYPFTGGSGSSFGSETILVARPASPAILNWCNRHFLDRFWGLGWSCFVGLAAAA